ncbi:HAMP domain-containing histidine kinase [filamentous cyanobacterium LEGE 11480]|uniref:HAMP domain-containing histidine kinase n=1 Tax=Romeriopsis navalis LEGE 11480 TaxID=2777977 RepID=A0A928Z3T2_9CYAN|nr:hypothetical protein [Romeriopsis navalis]MBE9029615.1 HAMP domain-containing histidine kinase [Romeriopsis navalis LEGE 11480]
MQVGTKRIQDIGLSLRNFSRLDEAKHEGAVDLHTGLDSTLMLLAHRIKLQTHHPAINIVKIYQSLPNLECYARQLNQTFINTLSNVIDAIERTSQDIESAALQTQPEIHIRTAAAPSTIQIRIAMAPV